MIKKIIGFFILGCLFIAIPLSMAGFEKVELGGPFLALLKNTSRDLKQFKIVIPDIPKIPALSQSGAGWDILRVVVSFFNGLISVLNILIMVVNYAIQLLEFLVLLIKNVITFRDSIRDYQYDFPYIT